MTIKGIDVSEHNGKLDWQKIKNNGIQFAIIRSSWGHFVEDKRLRTNVAECERIGMPYGLYHYSYSFDDTSLQQEVKGFTNLIQQFHPLYPCYVDMEDADGFLASQGVVNNVPFLTKVAKSFCQGIESVHYYAGIYANLYWFQTKLYADELDRYDHWLAQWANAPTFAKPFGLWQYTSEGSVPGSSARTDMNIAYKDYPTIIKVKGLNQASVEPLPPTPQPTKYSVGDQVHFHEIFVSSTSTQPLTPAITSGTITKVITARNPYLINDGTGWINDGSIDSSSPTLSVGALVKVKPGASDYTGNSLASFVYQTTYQVMEIKGDRVVIGKNGVVTAAISANNLYLV